MYYVANACSLDEARYMADCEAMAKFYEETNRPADAQEVRAFFAKLCQQCEALEEEMHGLQDRKWKQAYKEYCLVQSEDLSIDQIRATIP
jgi:hypothetical protein